MQGLFDFIIKPVGNRYSNIKKIGSEELIINTRIEDHKSINRTAIIVALPRHCNTSMKVGDEVVIHHNIFRSSYDNNGKAKNSRFFIQEDLFYCPLDCIFLYKNTDKWKAVDGYSFIKPIQSDNVYSIAAEKACVGVIKYCSAGYKQNELVGFRNNIEHEFVIDGELLYKIKSSLIEIKYERKGNEKEYNPSWAQSC
jgi:hypothetical protein